MELAREGGREKRTEREREKSGRKEGRKEGVGQRGRGGIEMKRERKKARAESKPAIQKQAPD